MIIRNLTLSDKQFFARVEFDGSEDMWYEAVLEKPLIELLIAGTKRKITIRSECIVSYDLD